MYTCECKEGQLQMGQSSGVLFKEVSAFQRCPLMEISLCTYSTCAHTDNMWTHRSTYTHIYSTHTNISKFTCKVMVRKLSLVTISIKKSEGISCS